jgi:hypothetical protein
MKQIFLITLFSLLVSQSFTQEINKKQWTLISKTTADWCSLCGGWGWNFQKQLIDNLENKNTIVWALHTSTSGLTNNTSKDIITNLGGSGQPRFFESQTNMNATSSNIATKLQEAIDIVDFNQLSEPIAGIGMTATIDDNNKISVNANVQFISKAEDGRFYLGLYLVEDKLVHPQANQGNNAVHRYVLRNSLLPSTFGENFANGQVAKDATFTIQGSLSDVTGNRENLKIAAIIWNRNSDGKYLFFNANMVDVDVLSNENTPVVSYTSNALFKEDNLTVSFQHPDPVSKIGLQLIDMQGKIVFTSQIENENHWEKTYNLPVLSGTYILKIDAGNLGSVSKKLIKI